MAIYANVHKFYRSGIGNIAHIMTFSQLQEKQRFDISAMLINTFVIPMSDKDYKLHKIIMQVNILVINIHVLHYIYYNNLMVFVVFPVCGQIFAMSCLVCHQGIGF